MSYHPGDVVVLTVMLTDSGGGPVDTDTVTCTVTAPDGTTTTPTVTHTGLGAHEAQVTAETPGRHVVAWLAGGSHHAGHTDAFVVVDPALLTVVSLDDAKRHLNMTGTQDDDEVEWMLSVAVAAGQSYTGRLFSRRPVVDVFTPPHRSRVLLTRTPVASITTATSGTGDVGCTLEDPAAGIVRTQAWPARPVTVAYVAGPAAASPADTQGVLEMLRHLWATQRGAAGPSVMRVGDDAYGQGWSLPRRVTELWDLPTTAGFA